MLQMAVIFIISFMSVNFFISCCLCAHIYITKQEQQLEVFEIQEEESEQSACAWYGRGELMMKKMKMK